MKAHCLNMLKSLDMTALLQNEELKLYIKGLQPYFRNQVLDKGADTSWQGRVTYQAGFYYFFQPKIKLKRFHKYCWPTWTSYFTDCCRARIQYTIA